jgi:hypothetical protein
LLPQALAAQLVQVAAHMSSAGVSAMSHIM